MTEEIRKPKPPPGSNVDNESGARDSPHKPRDKRAKFAKEITRSVFGRHYWDDGMAQALREALKKRPKK